MTMIHWHLLTATNLESYFPVFLSLSVCLSLCQNHLQRNFDARRKGQTFTYESLDSIYF